MKSIWKGYISFGLVSIPVRLYSSSDPQSFSFRQVCTKCKTPIHYKRVCEGCDREVPWNEIEKGIEIRKDKFLTISKEDLEKIKPDKSNAIDILEFTDSYQIEPVFMDKHYFCGPEKPKEKAFFLFKEVLSSTAKCAIGKFVMREKEYVCAISSYKKGLLLTTLNYAYEVRDINKVEELSEMPTLSKEELSLAKQLIDKLYKKSIDLSKFKDTFAEKLQESIDKLQKGEKITAPKERKKKEKSLIEALRASVK